VRIIDGAIVELRNVAYDLRTRAGAAGFLSAVRLTFNPINFRMALRSFGVENDFRKHPSVRHAVNQFRGLLYERAIRKAQDICRNNQAALLFG
jgi:hypothetical protein